MNKSEKKDRANSGDWGIIFFCLFWLGFQFLVPFLVCSWTWEQESIWGHELNFFPKAVLIFVEGLFSWFFSALTSLIIFQKMFPQLFEISEEAELRRQREKEKQKRVEKIRRQIWLMRREEAKSRLLGLVRSAQQEPELAALFRRLKKRADGASHEQVEKALNSSDLVLGGIGLWLKELGIPNSFPGHFLAGKIKNEIVKGFAGSSFTERKALGVFLPRMARAAENMLEMGFTTREVLELILPIFLQA